MVANKAFSIQAQLFDKIKDVVDPSLSLVNELADLLEVSADSAYRRLRCETVLSIDETVLLCEHYKVDLDIFSSNTSTVTFAYNQLKGIEGLSLFLSDLVRDMTELHKTGNAEIYYAAVDIPLFHHFKYKELAAFKMFYWLKDVLSEPSYDGVKFDQNAVPDSLLEIGKKVYDVYCLLPSAEIWTDATVNSSIAQIEFYFDSGLIESKELAITLCIQLEEQINDLQKQAEIGNKNTTEVSEKQNFKLYFSDIEIGNNCILTKKGDVKIAYLSFHTINKLVTVNPRFCDETENWINNLIKKSMQISGMSEKQRYKFFKQMNDKIEKLKYKIQNS